jgi:hypothetical protein
MKAYSSVISGLRRCFCGAALTGTLILGFTAVGAPTTFNSPAGTWDFVISGSQGEGLAYLTFLDDFTFSGAELLTAKPHPTSTPDIGRNSGGDTGRNAGSSSSTNSTAGSTNLFGYGPINGSWNFDIKGNVIGFFVERVEEADGADVILDSVSFTGKVAGKDPHKRFTLVASTPNGKVTYRGVQQSTTLTNASGVWYGIKTQGQQSFVEFFDVMAGPNPFAPPYLYSVTGTGAGYSFDGVCMLSSQKKIGFAYNVLPDDKTNTILRSVIGSFDPKKIKTSAKGVEEPNTAVHYNAIRYQLPPE